MVLRITGLASSTFYDRKKREGLAGQRLPGTPRGRPYPGYSWTADGQKVCDEQIKEWLMELSEGEEHTYGYKLWTQCLRDERGLILDKKKVCRLCKELGILKKQRKKRSKHPRRLPRNWLVTRPNQLWQMDIKYGYVAGKDRFFFVLSIIDVFDRVIVDYHRGAVCDTRDACETLLRAIGKRVGPSEAMPTIRTDNGPQFVSELFGDLCERLGIEHERIPPHTPNMNAYIESFHSLLERELLAITEFATFAEAYEAVDRYMDFYNHPRMHGSLRRMSPVRFSEWAMQLPDQRTMRTADFRVGTPDLRGLTASIFIGRV